MFGIPGSVRVLDSKCKSPHLGERWYLVIAAQIAETVDSLGRSFTVIEFRVKRFFIGLWLA